MKIVYTSTFWLLLASVLFPAIAHAQWSQVGSLVSSNERAVSIAVSRNGVPYIAIPDDEVVVRKYNGTAWEQVGHTGVYSAYDPCFLAVDPAGTPYILADTYANPGGFKLVIKKYNGNDWVPMGNAAISSAYIDHSSQNNKFITFDAAGTPYLAFNDNNHHINLLKYDGTSWISLDSGTIGGNINGFTCDSTGAVYLAYHNSQGAKNFVMKYNGTTRTSIDTAGLAPVKEMDIQFFISPDGTHYAIFSDPYVNLPVTIMKYDGAAWVPLVNGSFPFRTGTSGLIFDAAGTPYIFVSGFFTQPSYFLKYDGSGWVNMYTDGQPLSVITELVADTSGHFYIVDRANPYPYGDSVSVMKYTVGTTSASVAGVGRRTGSITISPVPAMHFITIRNSAAGLNNAAASITDIQGREVYRFAISPVHSIDVSAWSAGIYCLHLPGGEVMKMVKE